MTVKKDQKCGNCYYWRGNNACRFFPPKKKQVFTTEPNVGPKYKWVYTETHPDLWCGQWRLSNG